MGEVVNLDLITKLDLPPARILSKAQEAELEGCIILGFDNQGELFFASSYADGGTVLWLMEKAKKQLMDVEA